ncbi:hypothetical protein D3C71_1309500 [compost metagenome]
MLASALRRNRCNRSFQNFQQRLLNTFARNVARDGRVLGLAGHFIDFIDIDDAALGFFHIVISSLNKLQENVLYVFADVTGLGKGGRIRNCERNIDDLRHRLGQQRLAGTGRSEQQNVALRQLDVLDFALAVDALVMVVYGYGQGFLRLLLADYILVENIADLFWLRNILQVQFFLMTEFLFHDFRAQLDTFIAYINARPRNELANLLLGFPAERAFQLPFFIIKFKHLTTP